MESKFIPNEIISYCERSSTDNSSIIDNILSSNINEEGSHMMIGNMSSYFLRTLLLLSKPKSILEIGSFLGYTTSILLEYTNSNCKIISLEENVKNYIKAKINLSNYKSDNKLQLTNSEGISYLINTSSQFDLIFIDARKEVYFDKLDLIYTKLNINGLLVVDNALAGLGVLNPKKDWHNQTIIFNNTLKADSRFISTIIPVRDGFSLAVKIK